MKKLLSLVTALALTFPSLAYTEVVNGIEWQYSVSNGKAEITGVSSNISGDITIPSTLGGYPVTTIGDYAFYDCGSLTGVTIPEGVTSIGYWAFEYCSSLANVTIPSSVTSIGEDAFGETKIYDNAPDGLFIKDGWVLDVKEICPSTVVIPNGVRGIADFAFRGCNDFSVTIPSSVTSIGNCAFFACRATMSVNFANPNYKSDGTMLFTKDGKTLLWSSASVMGVTIPSSVTIIGDNAFAYCNKLTGIIIPSSVTIIGEWAFNHCISLTSVTIPSSVTEIGNNAFYECNNLTSVTISEGVTTMGSDAFGLCSNLKSVTIPSSVTLIGTGAFSKTKMYNDASNGIFIKDGWVLWVKGTRLSEVVIPNGIRGIAGGAFEDCGFTSVVIPEGVISIGNYAFIGCKSLTSVTIPSSVTIIDEYAFSLCPLRTVCVHSGDNERVKKLLVDSGYDVSGVQFVELKPEPEPLLPSEVKPSGAFKAEGAVTQTGIIVENGVPKATVQVKIGKANKKGISKITVTVIDMDGKKYTGKGEAKIGDAQNVTVAVKKWGNVSFKLADNGFGSENVMMFASNNVGDATAQFEAGDLSMFTGVLTDYLPNEAVTRTDKKWKVVAKAGKLKYNKKIGKFEVKGDNIGALKLTYAAKTATFKGSFKVWSFDDVKKKLKGTSAKITGIVAAGDGYGKAVVKKTEIGKIVVK